MMLSSLKVDAPPETAIELCLEPVHLVSDLAEFLFELFDFVADLLHGSGELFLHLGDWQREERVADLVSRRGQYCEVM